MSEMKVMALTKLLRYQEISRPGNQILYQVMQAPTCDPA